MKRTVPFLSLGLNIVLLGAILFVLRKPAEKISVQPVRDIANVATRVVETVSEPTQTTPIASAPFDWSQIESGDFLIYAQNLRSIGCPEETVRDIVTAEINQFFVQRRQEMIRPMQNQFWDSMAQGVNNLIGDELKKKLDALGEEKEALLKEVFRESGDAEKPYYPGQYELVLGDLLSPEKVQELRVISENIGKLREEFELADPAEPEKRKKIGALNKELAAEQESLLSPEELEEFKLRKSSFSQQLHGMLGFEADEEELRALARLTEAEKELGKPKVEEQIKTLLGEKRFSEFQRSTNSSFHDLNRIARRYELPMETVAQAYDFVRVATEQVNAVKNSQEILDEQREATLEAIRTETQAALISQLGLRAAEMYRRNSGDWDHIARP